MSLCSILPLDPEMPEAWIAYTPGGAYNANRSARRLLRWRIGMILQPTGFNENMEDAVKVAAGMAER